MMDFNFADYHIKLLYKGVQREFKVAPLLKTRMREEIWLSLTWVGIKLNPLMPAPPKVFPKQSPSATLVHQPCT